MITVIDYGLGNLASVANALGRLEIPYQVSSDLEVINKATALILPGVGAAGQGMENLKTRKMDTIIVERAREGIPILGICLGMQLLFSLSEEGNVNCLGLIKGRVKKFTITVKVPQIGWNEVEVMNDSLLLKNIKNNRYFYFVNSFYCEPVNKQIIKGSTDYSLNFCSVLEKNNLFGVQFHPEKSGEVGLQLLKNFWEVVC